MRFDFCPRCGARTTERPVGDEGPVDFCVACDRALLDLPAPGVLVVVVNARGEVALLRQRHISDSHWVLVAGWVAHGETAEEAVRREVAEETGLTVTSCRYLASFHHGKSESLLLGFRAEADGEVSSESVEVDEAAWVPIAGARALLRPGSIGLDLFERAAAGLPAAPPGVSVECSRRERS